MKRNCKFLLHHLLDVGHHVKELGDALRALLHGIHFVLVLQKAGKVPDPAHDMTKGANMSRWLGGTFFGKAHQRTWC